MPSGRRRGCAGQRPESSTGSWRVVGNHAPGTALRKHPARGGSTAPGSSALPLYYLCNILDRRPGSSAPGRPPPETNPTPWMRRRYLRHKRGGVDATNRSVPSARWPTRNNSRPPRDRFERRSASSSVSVCCRYRVDGSRPRGQAALSGDARSRRLRPSPPAQRQQVLSSPARGSPRHNLIVDRAMRSMSFLEAFVERADGEHAEHTWMNGLGRLLTRVALWPSSNLSRHRPMLAPQWTPSVVRGTPPDAPQGRSVEARRACRRVVVITGYLGPLDPCIVRLR